MCRPAPAPPAQPFAIKLRILRQHVIEGSLLIGELHRAEIAVRGLGEVASASAHAAVIHVQHRKAVKRQHLVEEKSAPIPLICDQLGMRSSIRVQNQWNAVR